MSQQFPLGAVPVFDQVKAALTDRQVSDLLARHAAGDWSQAREFANTRAIRRRDRIFTEFWVNSADGRPLRVWVVTEEGHARTFVMFPSESPYRASDVEEVRGSFLPRGLPFL